MTKSLFSKKVIFAVDDEKDIQEILKINLENDGYEVFTFSNGDSAFKALLFHKPDLILLDVMMDGIDGFEFCRKVRSQKENADVPVIFLSAKSDEFDKVLGLEIGGDDYITKPFSIKELRSRVKAVIRRTGKTNPENNDNQILRYKGIELNPEHYSLTVDGADVALTKTEFGMLFIFLKNPGKIFTRDNIIDSIRGNDVYVIDRTIDVHIMNMRKKLGPYKEIIKTFSGVGYGFKE